jgi:hypothetical protein
MTPKPRGAWHASFALKRADIKASEEARRSARIADLGVMGEAIARCSIDADLGKRPLVTTREACFHVADEPMQYSIQRAASCFQRLDEDADSTPANQSLKRAARARLTLLNINC